MVKAVIAVAVIILVIRLYLNSVSLPKYQIGDQVKITASLTTEPIKVYQKTYVIVAGISIPVPPEVELSYDDKFTATGTLAKPLINNKSVKFSLVNGNFVLLSNSLSLLGWSRQLHDKLIYKQLRWLPGDEGALAAGILIGGTGQMSYELKNNFNRVSLTHVVAASGYNVTLLAAWTMLILGKWLNRRLVIYLSIVSIILYVFIAGATASVIRAGIMATAAWSGKLWGRESNSLWLLALAAWSMLMINPNYLADIGFQLSLAATTGILWAGPKNDWWTSIAAQAATIPLILHHFGNLSVVAPVVNILLLWMIAPLMQILALGLVSGPVNWLAWPGLKLMNSVVNGVGSWSWASWQVGYISWWWVIGYYVVIVISYELVNRRFGLKRH